MKTRERLAKIALAIAPVLKQVVLAGPPVIEMLITDPTVPQPTTSFAADATLQLLSTAMVDRIGADLKKLGFARTGRTPHGDKWQIGDELGIELIQVRTEDSDPEQVWLEYATLLTLPLAVDESTTVRIAGGPAMLALECSAFSAAAERVFDSEHAERILLLLAGRAEIEREAAAAPPELRTFVATTFGRIAQSDALQLLIERILPDAAALPAIAERVIAKLRRIAALAC
jgi:hypothetical protein